MSADAAVDEMQRAEEVRRILIRVAKFTQMKLDMGATGRKPLQDILDLCAGKVPDWMTEIEASEDLFGPQVPEQSIPAPADANLAACVTFISKLVNMQSGDGWSRAAVRTAAIEFLREHSLQLSATGNSTPEFVAATVPEENMPSPRNLTREEQRYMQQALLKSGTVVDRFGGDAPVPERAMTTPLGYCQCEAPLIRCDDRGCRCVFCGNPEWIDLPSPVPVENMPTPPADLVKLIETELEGWRGSNGGIFTLHACAIGVAKVLMQAQVSSRLRPASPQDEIAWLIEADASVHATPHWWGRTDDGESLLGWTPKHSKAMRFVRREDAQLYIDDTGWTVARPTEHVWCAPREQVVPKASMKMAVDAEWLREIRDREIERLREALEELVDIVQDAIDQQSTKNMDSFTLQPARAALASAGVTERLMPVLAYPGEPMSKEGEQHLATLIRAAMPLMAQAPEPEPIAWVYELASAMTPDGEYCQWRRCLTDYRPCVPDKSIRNLTALYPRPVSEQSMPVARPTHEGE